MDTKASAHTPGPWHIVGRGYAVYGEHGAFSALIADTNSPLRENAENEANAALISAAPDLLAALREMLVYAADDSDDKETRAVGACERARAAIAKATGGK